MHVYGECAVLLSWLLLHLGVSTIVAISTHARIHPHTRIVALSLGIGCFEPLSTRASLVFSIALKRWAAILKHNLRIAYYIWMH